MVADESQLPDRWTTIADEVRASIRVQRSEFIGIAFPCGAEEQFRKRLDEIQREYHDATHHCWAFTLFSSGEILTRNSDAGEPAGSAGRPIAMTIEGSGLSDMGIVVVRYYGGVKLGTGGLARAYRDAALAALADVSRVERAVTLRIAVKLPFARTAVAYRLIDPPDIALSAERHHAEGTTFVFDVRRGRLAALRQELIDQQIEVDDSSS